MQDKVARLEEELSCLKNDIEPQREKLRNLLKFIQFERIPDKKEAIGRIVAASKFIAGQLTNDQQEQKEIEQAAELCYLPYAMFKDKFHNLPVMVNGIVSNTNMYDYNKFVEKMLGDLKGYEITKKILNSVYENFDGSGIPNKIKNWAIPLGSRIIRVASDFEYYRSHHPKHLDRIIPMLWNEINRVYDFRVLAFYDQYLAYLNTMSTPQKRASEAVVNPYVLEPGMVLSRTIITISGLRLLNANYKLDLEAIQKIQDAKTADAVIGHIFVKIESIPVPNVK
jgi:response regulator RpfG family c-di-GMP phosphodiesterase